MFHFFRPVQEGIKLAALNIILFCVKFTSLHVPEIETDDDTNNAAPSVTSRHSHSQLASSSTGVEQCFIQLRRMSQISCLNSPLANHRGARKQALLSRRFCASLAGLSSTKLALQEL